MCSIYPDDPTFPPFLAINFASCVLFVQEPIFVLIADFDNFKALDLILLAERPTNLSFLILYSFKCIYFAVCFSTWTASSTEQRKNSVLLPSLVYIRYGLRIL